MNLSTLVEQVWHGFDLATIFAKWIIESPFGLKGTFLWGNTYESFCIADFATSSMLWREMVIGISSSNLHHNLCRLLSIAFVLLAHVQCTWLGKIRAALHWWIACFCHLWKLTELRPALQLRRLRFKVVLCVRSYICKHIILLFVSLMLMPKTGVLASTEAEIFTSFHPFWGWIQNTPVYRHQMQKLEKNAPFFFFASVDSWGSYIAG